MLNLHHIQPLRQLLAAFVADPAAQTPGPCPPAELSAVPTADADVDASAGCGWFDSSHELQHGLSVREHASAETLGDELPLANWLEWHLAGWSPALST